jgi:hypothetical protein
LPELTDKEETIKAYLEKDETLTPEILDEVLSQLWTEEPFKYDYLLIFKPFKRNRLLIFF